MCQAPDAFMTCGAHSPRYLDPPQRAPMSVNPDALEELTRQRCRLDELTSGLQSLRQARAAETPARPMMPAAPPSSVLPPAGGPLSRMELTKILLGVTSRLDSLSFRLSQLGPELGETRRAPSRGASPSSSPRRGIYPPCYAAPLDITFHVEDPVVMASLDSVSAAAAVSVATAAAVSAATIAMACTPTQGVRARMEHPSSTLLRPDPLRPEPLKRQDGALLRPDPSSASTAACWSPRQPASWQSKVTSTSVSDSAAETFAAFGCRAPEPRDLPDYPASAAASPAWPTPRGGAGPWSQRGQAAQLSPLYEWSK